MPTIWFHMNWYKIKERVVLKYPFVHIFLIFIEFVSLSPQKIGLVMRYVWNMEKVILQGLFNQSHLNFDVRKFQFNLEVSNLQYKDIMSMQQQLLLLTDMLTRVIWLVVKTFRTENINSIFVTTFKFILAFQTLNV